MGLPRLRLSRLAADVVKGSGWRFSDLWTEPPLGRLSVHKFWTNASGLVLVTSFLYETIRRGLEFTDWIGFGIAMLGVTAPATFGKYIGLTAGRPAAPAPVVTSVHSGGTKP